MADGEVIPIIPLPRSRKAKASVWRDIGVAETDHVLRLASVEDTRTFLKETFGIGDYSDGKSTIVLDMFYYAVQFCKENHFNSEKTSSFLSILKQIHEMAIETPFNNIRETLDFLKDLILCHSVHRPPFSVAIFSPQEATLVSSYLIDSYFRHFKMYKFVFNPQVELNLTINYTAFPKSSRNSGRDSRSTFADAIGDDSARTEVLEDENAAPLNDPTQAAHSDEPATKVAEPQDSNANDNLQFDSETDSVRALQRLIRDRLAAEIQQLQSNVSTKLQQSEDEIGKAAVDAATKQHVQAAAKKKK